MPDTTSSATTAATTTTGRLSLRKRLRRLPITLYVGGTLVSLFVLVALVSFLWTP